MCIYCLSVLNIQSKIALIGTFLVDLIDKILDLFIATIQIGFKCFVDCTSHSLLVLLLSLLGSFIFRNITCIMLATKQDTSQH